MVIMKRRRKTADLMDTLKAAAAQIPPDVARMTDKQIDNLIQAARRDARKVKSGGSSRSGRH